MYDRPARKLRARFVRLQNLAVTRSKYPLREEPDRYDFPCLKISLIKGVGKRHTYLIANDAGMHFWLLRLLCE